MCYTQNEYDKQMIIQMNLKTNKMKVEVTRKELTLLLMGLYAASEHARSEEEASEYDELSDYIASIIEKTKE